MHARSLLLTAPRRFEWLDEDLPDPESEEVLIETRSGAISIGTELPQYLGTARASRPKAYPSMTGYESVGIVIARGRTALDRKVGDRVVALYGHRSRAIVAASKTIRVPDDVSDRLALLAILSCDVAKGVRKLFGAGADPASLQQPILVTGAGTIGLLTIFFLRANEARSVDVVEPRGERRALALELGARRALSPHEAQEDGREPYSTALECSGRNAAFELAQSLLRHDGRMCILSDGNLEPLVLAPAFHEKELSLVGSSDGWDYQRHAAWYFEAAHHGWSHLERIFDHRTSAGELIATFERLATGEIAPTKVLVGYRP